MDKRREFCDFVPVIFYYLLPAQFNNITMVLNDNINIQILNYKMTREKYQREGRVGREGGYTQKFENLKVYIFLKCNFFYNKYMCYVVESKFFK